MKKDVYIYEIIIKKNKKTQENEFGFLTDITLENKPLTYYILNNKKDLCIEDIFNERIIFKNVNNKIIESLEMAKKIFIVNVENESIVEITQS